MTDLAYELLDSGGNRKLERFGEVVLDRPWGQAVWERCLPEERWRAAQGRFSREGDSGWEIRDALPDQWLVNLHGLSFRLEPTNFGHVGVFPEHSRAWNWIEACIRTAGRPVNVLNLFAYTGGGTLAAARAGARVCHLDASRKSTSWARENAAINNMTDAPIRWITDDVIKFLKRENRRENGYDGILLDPPSFGRGTRKEVFALDKHIGPLMALCRDVLSPQPLFVALTCHSPGYTPTVLSHLLTQMMARYPGAVESEEMMLSGATGVLPLPNGAFAGWRGQA